LKIGQVVLPLIFWYVLTVVTEHNRLAIVLSSMNDNNDPGASTLASESESESIEISTTPFILNATKMPTTATTPTTTTSFPVDASAARSRTKGTNYDSIMRELSFVYANTTYRFRYHVNTAITNGYDIIDGIATRRKGRSDPVSNKSDLNRLPTIVFGVLSTSSRQIRRDTIRSTWGSNVQMYFLVAEPFHQHESASSSSSSSSLLTPEFLKYGDLLWLDVPENYRNALTPKTFMFLQFVRRVLLRRNKYNQTNLDDEITDNSSIDYVFKTDDDVFVNATEIGVELVKEKWPAYYGMNMSGVPLRDSSAKVGAKWVLTKEEYDRDDYPPYASGLGYALSSKVNALLDINNDCLDETMSFMRAMPWEDVATGLLSEACHVPLTSAYNYWTDTGNGTHNPYLPWEAYDTYKDGGTIVKILHKPRPHWYRPLMNKGSLEKANANFEQKRKGMRQAQRKQHQQQQQEHHNHNKKVTRKQIENLQTE
jgi:Galactosyltransferase